MVNPQLKAVIEACDRAISQEDYDTLWTTTRRMPCWWCSQNGW